MLVQPALLWHPEPRAVLIIGGGEPGRLAGLLAHAVGCHMHIVQLIVDEIEHIHLVEVGVRVRQRPDHELDRVRRIMRDQPRSALLDPTQPSGTSTLKPPT